MQFGKKKEQKKTVHRRRDTREKTFFIQILIGFVWILAVCTLLYGVYYITHIPRYLIEQIEVEGGKTISHDEVRGKVESTLRGSYFLVIPRRFTYLYPYENVVSVVEATPRVKDVVVRKTNRNTLSVSFDEYLPYALWCGDGEGSDCYFIDEHGYAFDISPLKNGGTLMRHMVEGKQVKRGMKLDAQVFETMEQLAHRIEDTLDFRIASILYKENGDVEFNVNGGGTFYVASKNDPELTYENLEAVLTSEAYSHLKPGNFQYVDVRFEKKVFVNEELSNENATSTSEVATSTQAEPNN